MKKLMQSNKKRNEKDPLPCFGDDRNEEGHKKYIWNGNSRGQFHQHFTCSFCAGRLAPVNHKPKT